MNFCRTQATLMAICLASLTAVGPAETSGTQTMPIGRNSELTQVSTINALIQGNFDGSVRMADLLTHGDFGIGTLDHLDGEMITLDGVAYQAAGDGKVNKVAGDVTTPFASITGFAADTTYTLSGVESLAALQKQLDEHLPSHNYFYAVKVHGTFPAMKVRSVPRQEKPYRPLTTIVNEQRVFDYEGVTGTLIGFRCPDYVQGVNVAAYHMHFLSDDKAKGGHVLNLTMAEGQVEVDNLSDFRMILPRDGEFMRQDLGDRNEAGINKVEKAMGAPAGKR